MIRLMSAALLLLTACGETPETVDVADPSLEGPAADAQTRTTDDAITAEDLAARISTLASDEFEGRAPGTKGGAKTVDYLERTFQEIGLAPAGENGGYRQSVPLVTAQLDVARSSLSVNAEDGTDRLDYAEDVVFWTKRIEPSIAVEASELVFAGYGVVAPEYRWNDYDGLDVSGKTVVVLVNDPGYEVGEDVFFNGRAMTYYGRWTYKYEEAARQGAAGVLLVHETGPAGYPWSVVSGSWSGPQIDLDRSGDAGPRAAFEGWLSLDAARALFRTAGLDFDDEKRAALSPSFTPKPLGGLTIDARLETGFRNTVSYNLAGRLEGAERPDEHIIYTAHWDHLGRDFSGEDQISNGAVDNATGVAAMLEIAEAFANGSVAPKRSVLFLAVTAEESGLLGSAYYAESPLFPLRDAVAGYNIDAMHPIGPTKDVIVVGSGASELEDQLRVLVEADGRYLRPDPEAEKGYFYRSDHISLAKKGVPMLYIKSGIDAIDGGTEFGRAFKDAYTAERYHKPADEYDDTWNLDGLVNDTRLLYEAGRRLSFTDGWPNWYEGNEFRSIRDQQRANLD